MNLFLLPNVTAAAVLAVTFLHVWRISRERYLFIWTVASMLWVSRYAWGILQPTLMEQPPEWVVPAAALLRATLFLWGASEMTARRFPHVWWLFAGVAGAWQVAAPESVGPVMTVLPIYVVFSGGMIGVAWLVGNASRFPALERGLTAGPMVVYGLLQLSFPWSDGALASFAPLAYMVASVTQVAFAMGILVMYFRAAEQDLVARHARLAQALRRALSGHLDICQRCHSVQTEDGSWRRIEAYVSGRTGTAFSHGICPTCLDRHYPGYDTPLGP